MAVYGCCSAWPCRRHSSSLDSLAARSIARRRPFPPKCASMARALMTADDILTGQTVWQSTGGQQLGSIWGHGAYQAPDWSADWLHREATTLLDLWSGRDSACRMRSSTRRNRHSCRRVWRMNCAPTPYDPASGVVTISADRAEAIARVAQHYDDLFGGAPALQALRDDYAMQDVVVPDPVRRVGAHQVLLLDQLGIGHQSTGPGADLHQQLAARAVDQQRAHRGQRAVVDRQRGAAAGRHWRARVVHGVSRR